MAKNQHVPYYNHQLSFNHIQPKENRILKLSNSLTTLFIVAVVLFSAGFVCSDSDSGTTPGNTSTSNTSKSNATTPAPVTPKSIAGDYDATGTNTNGGSPYKASLVITPHDDVYQFSWDSNGKTSDGVGVMTDNAVAVAYTDGTSGKGCGVVLYKIGSDGSLDGKSGYWGVNSAEAEKATRTSGTDLEGKYDIAGKNPEGKEYKGTLEVKKDGEGYTFIWNAGSVLEGFGVKTGDKVAVGFGGKQCAFVSYEVKSDGTLDGKWGGRGSKTFGTEVAKRK
jgi:hypothetical protein